ncbi:RNA polymerase factor sigma-54 [Paenibacillus roseipurpureus]|uniref:RNA polymerase factor sigma-54 n=1 Tax=Paenibacillus roseopurpureus TaxID=2918901 RepID=A0AA96LRZ6_9BACL|nr:RNA polymerase factor sigma-54 [Paenibacillus sp. MBLB1832]WNR45476.1 RNA polymerase factor sigma-54 [Paenibacillus sp. MBLB1832]
MSQGYRLFQQQSTKLQLSPQLRQAITLLQLSTPDMLQAIQQEVEGNPLLEYEKGYGRTAEAEFNPHYNVVSNKMTLERHLKEQLLFTPELSVDVRRILSFLIGNLDANGYLTISMPDAANYLRVTQAGCEEALRVLQGLEPAGIGARNLQECLLLQIQRTTSSEGGSLMEELVRHHLPDISRNRLTAVSVKLQVPLSELQAAVMDIKRLNPRPAASYHTETVPYILPEVVFVKQGDRYAAYTYEAAWPRLTLNTTYERMARERNGSAEATTFVQSKLYAARFFLRSLEQRRQTILRVAQCMAEEQHEFFMKGAASQKPMTLKIIADQLGLHESTVSRATSGKYAQTPWGIRELKSFFSSSLSTEQGDAASSAAVKALLKTWIGKEKHDQPYSDQKLADLLAQSGISISRRTVAKYREELRIPSSQLRKRI